MVSGKIRHAAIIGLDGAWAKSTIYDMRAFVQDL